VNKNPNEKQDREHILRLKSVTPEEWVRLTNQIDESIRNQVINIIWWDFFGLKLQHERWHHFDDVISQRVTVIADVHDLYDALLKCGYTPKIAFIRLNMKRLSRDKAPRHRPRNAAAVEGVSK